jgi:hypothetical protein
VDAQQQGQQQQQGQLQQQGQQQHADPFEDPN